jgi:hypothetical protein
MATLTITTEFGGTETADSAALLRGWRNHAVAQAVIKAAARGKAGSWETPAGLVLVRPVDLLRHHYEDTAASARDCLRSLSDLDVAEDARARPDPEVRGVWEVYGSYDGQEVRAIVYLAGHPNPWGDDRELNDFECEDY